MARMISTKRTSFATALMLTVQVLACGPGMTTSIISSPVPEEVGDPNAKTLSYHRGNTKKLALSNGWRYCQHIEDHASRVSAEWAWIGLPSLAIGAGAALAGGTLVVRDAVDSDSSGYDRRVNALLDGGILAGGALFVALGAYALSRSSAAARAVRASNLGSREPYRASDPIGNNAFDACERAKADWASSREQANDAAKEAVEAYKEGFQDGSDAGGGGGASDGGADAGPTAQPAVATSTADAGGAKLDAGK